MYAMVIPGEPTGSKADDKGLDVAPDPQVTDVTHNDNNADGGSSDAKAGSDDPLATHIGETVY